MSKINLFGRITNKDILLGNLLAKEAIKSEIPENCPSLEKIAALAENNIAEQNQNELMSHLNHCSYCYQFYIDAVRVHSKYHLRKKINNFFKVAMPIAAAASLVIYIGLSVKIGLPGKSLFTNTAQVIRNIYRDTDEQGRAFHEKKNITEKTGIDSLTAENIAIQINSSGAAASNHLFMKSKFAAIVKGKGISELEERNRSIIKLGILLVDLDIMRSIDDTELRKQTLKEIEKILVNYSWASNLSEYFTKLESDMNLTEVGKASSFSELFFSKHDTITSLKLGEWIEGARISLHIGNMDFFKAYPFKVFIGDLQRIQLTGLARNSLLNIEQILVDQLPSEIETIKLRNEIDTLISSIN